MSTELTPVEVAQRAKGLRPISVMRPLLQVLLNWAAIALALALLYLHSALWLYLAAIVFISTRQYALAILLHDAQHTLLHPDRSVNRLLATWLIAAPLGTDFDSSQKGHLNHHHYLGARDRDPDFPLYCFGAPSPKQTPAQVLRLFVGSLLGFKILSMVNRAADAGGIRPAPEAARPLPSVAGAARRLWRVMAAHLALLVVLSFFFGWYGYLLLWAFPLATLAALYNDLRIFCEHSLCGREAVKREERLISYLSNPFERLFFAPNHMNYHAEHHLFPFVPHSRLPELHDAIRACPELSARIEWRLSYVRHLIDYFTAGQPVRAAAALPLGHNIVKPRGNPA